MSSAQSWRWDYCGPFISSCKKLLRVIVLSEPKIRKSLNTKRKALDKVPSLYSTGFPVVFLLISTRSSARSKAIEGLGQHGLVGTSDENLMNLHDALKVEFHRVVQSYKVALSKLEVNSLLAAGLVGVVHWLHSSLSAPSGTGPGAQEDGGAHRVVGTGAGAGVAPASAVAQTGSISCCRCR